MPNLVGGAVCVVDLRTALRHYDHYCATAGLLVYFSMSFFLGVAPPPPPMFWEHVRAFRAHVRKECARETLAYPRGYTLPLSRSHLASSPAHVRRHQNTHHDIVHTMSSRADPHIYSLHIDYILFVLCLPKIPSSPPPPSRLVFRIR